MKKFIWFIMAAVFVFTACTDEHYYTTELNVVTQQYKVTDNMWQKGSDDTGSYLFYEVAEPGITEKVIKDGIVAGYFYYALGNVSYLSPLPYSDFVLEYDNDGYLTGYKWEEQMTVDFSPGYVTFILKYDDHAEDERGFPAIPFYTAYEFVVKYTRM